jgi:hypothetical protein
MTAKADEMKERRALVGSTTTITSDNPPTTFHALANLDNSLGGRFATGGDVSGTEEVVRYPRQSPNSPWSSSSRVPDEPPLGFAIDAVDNVTGEFNELAASQGLPSLEATSAPPLELTRSDSTSGGELSVRVASSHPKAGDASRAGAVAASEVDGSIPCHSAEVERAASVLSRAELDELFGRWIVKPGKERGR